jgi:hypothetical protein
MAPFWNLISEPILRKENNMLGTNLFIQLKVGGMI